MQRYFTVFTNRRMLIALLLGFSAGIPLALVGSTLQAWLTESKVDVATIGMFALVGYPYALKFLWAPLLDLRPLPFLGLRRGWMVVSQIGLLVATLSLAIADPTQSLVLFSSLALLVAFFSASQDIVIDAYRSEIIVAEDELGAGAASYITGYRIATVVSGGLALILADHLSWMTVYMIMGAINLVGLATILLSPEPAVVRKLKKGSLKDTVFLPFVEFFQRSGAMEILIFIMVYKLSTLMATALMTKFMMDLGYTKTMIGATSKGFGLGATLVGTIIGGSVMAKLGLKRSLWSFGIMQSFVGLTFCLLSVLASSEGAFRELWLVIIICLDNLMMAMGTVALTGFMMSVCNRQFTATQYALLSSVMAVSRVVLVAHAGTVVAAVGWNVFFVSTVALALPGLLMLRRFDHWHNLHTGGEASRFSGFEKALIMLFVGSLLLLSSDPIWQMLELKEQGAWVAWAGAIGIIVLITVNIVRPYLIKSKIA
jgi:MFS transporter, PAT family, beta-lactamase induction signal transducer AmpG